MRDLKLSAALGLASLLYLLPALTSCEPKEYFSEYQSTNLISAYPFDPAAGTPQWTVAYGDPVVPVNHAYMTASAVTLGTEFTSAAGLPAGTADHTRLEIPNLAQNGDFEGGDTGWASTSPGTVTVSSTAPEAIDGNTLYSDLAGGDDYTYNIETGMTAAAGAAAYETGARYLFRGDYRTWNTNYWEYSNNGNAYQIILPYLSATESGSAAALQDSGINNEFLLDGAGETLRIYSASSSHEGSLDNFRILRSDITPRYQLEICQEVSGKPILISGYYRFSCYYRAEESSEVTPTTPNTFRSTNLTIKAETLEDGNPVASLTAVQPLGNTPGNWKKLTVEGYLPIYSPSSSSNPVLRLSITPTEMQTDKDIGRLLVAAPALHFSPTPW